MPEIDPAALSNAAGGFSIAFFMMRMAQVLTREIRIRRRMGRSRDTER